MTTYLVGAVASPDADAALDWALATATADDRIVAVHAWEVPIATGYEVVAAVDTEAIESSADRFVAEVLAARADDRLSAQVVNGHPGHALAQLAEEAAGDVTVVVGYSGSTKLGFVMGSTANYVVHHARTTVVVVRGALRLPVRRVVVGIDEPHKDHPDEPSLAALRWALRLPGVERVEVQHAAFVPGVAAGPLSQPGVESEPEVDALDGRLRDVIELALEGGRPPSGAEIVPLVTGGTGAFALIEASRAADLVVVGTRGHRSLVQLITGSTTLDVLAHAHCPVAVAR